MRKKLTDIIGNNWFFVSLICFAIVLPLSNALVSIVGSCVLLVAIVDDKWKNKLNRFKQNIILLWIPSIYFLYFLSALVSNNFNQSLYDLRKNLFFLILPLAFIFGKTLNSKQKRYLFYVFSTSVFISTLVALLNWTFFGSTARFGVHNASLISHIRFSFQLVLAFWLMVILVNRNFSTIRRNYILLYSFMALYFVSFLLFQQSLTGIISLITSLVFYIAYLISTTSFKKRIILFAILALIIIIPAAYTLWIITDFYNIEKVNPETIDKKTSKGNTYKHDFNNPMVENGKYVYLYVCHKEAREEWNKISEIKYDSIGGSGYPIHSTLIRYLTSKGLRKDAEGFKMLTPEDISNIEHGIANIIYVKKKFSLYPRIYQTIWEYYIYSKTGNANHQSFSQRIEFAKAAISIIEQNFWFGVGTARWKQEFGDAYIKNKSKLDPKLYASAHNQYLNYMVKFGFIGFVFILFAIVYPILKRKRYKDLLFMLFLVYMFFANFADSNFESHMGSSFFVFFYCVFMIDGINYLKIQTK